MKNLLLLAAILLGAAPARAGLYYDLSVYTDSSTLRVGKRGQNRGDAVFISSGTTIVKSTSAVPGHIAFEVLSSTGAKLLTVTEGGVVAASGLTLGLTPGSTTFYSSTTWTTPDGVYSGRITQCGGGAGAGGAGNSVGDGPGGGGGAGEIVYCAYVRLTPGEVNTIVIGTGGVGGLNSGGPTAGSNGADTKFMNSQTAITAQGGFGGSPNSGNNGGAGGDGGGLLGGDGGVSGGGAGVNGTSMYSIMLSSVCGRRGGASGGGGGTGNQNGGMGGSSDSYPGGRGGDGAGAAYAGGGGGGGAGLGGGGGLGYDYGDYADGFETISTPGLGPCAGGGGESVGTPNARAKNGVKGLIRIEWGN